MGGSYVPLSKSGEKLRAHKIITVGPRAPVLWSRLHFFGIFGVIVGIRVNFSDYWSLFLGLVSTS